MGKGLTRLGLTLRLNWNEMQAVRNMTPKGKKEKDFAKYCMLVGLNQVVENAKKRFAEQQEKEELNKKLQNGDSNGNGQGTEGVSASSSEDASKSSSNSDLQQTELPSVRDDSGNQ